MMAKKRAFLAGLLSFLTASAQAANKPALPAPMEIQTTFVRNNSKTRLATAFRLRKYAAAHAFEIAVANAQLTVKRAVAQIMRRAIVIRQMLAFRTTMELGKT